MSGKAECPSCGEVFASDDSFDRHRVGPIDDRRCLTVAELEAGLPATTIAKRHGAWSEVRYTRWRRNARGHWTHRAAEREFPTGQSAPEAVSAPTATQGPPGHPATLLDGIGRPA